MSSRVGPEPVGPEPAALILGVVITRARTVDAAWRRVRGRGRALPVQLEERRALPSSPAPRASGPTWTAG